MCCSLCGFQELRLFVPDTGSATAAAPPAESSDIVRALLFSAMDVPSVAAVASKRGLQANGEHAACLASGFDVLHGFSEHGFSVRVQLEICGRLHEIRCDLGEQHHALNLHLNDDPRTNLKFWIQANHNCCLRIVNRDSDGNVLVVVPNILDGYLPLQVHANHPPARVPPKRQPCRYQIQVEHGSVYEVYAVV